MYNPTLGHTVFRSFVCSLNFSLNTTDIDKEAVAKIVDDIVRSNGTKWIPDAIERHLYTNVVTVLLRIMDVLANKTRIIIFGHEISIDIKPAS